jgi:hypothetical protein
MTAFVEVRGELYVTVESAAECYRVDVRWIEEVRRHGVLGPAELVGGAQGIPVSALDRLAAVLRWHRHLGLDLETAAALLDAT